MPHSSRLLKNQTNLAKQDYDKTFSQQFNALNNTQKEAVNKTEGPVMVVAGPGTGKTQLLAARIGHILKVTDARPYNILCLTYTEAGSIAMRQRLLEFIGPEAYRVGIFTFHAFCNDIIQRNPDYFGSRELEPVSELENIEILRDLLDKLPSKDPLKRKSGKIYYEVPLLKNLFQKMKEEAKWTPEYISSKADEYLEDLPYRDGYIYKRGNSKKGIKVGDLKQAAIDKEADRMEKLKSAANLFPGYLKSMQQRNRYDYHDMLIWVLNAFQKDDDFLRRYQERFLYFLIDEYQDTNGTQNELLNSLIDFWEEPNIFVVGDDDQCIYEFQGARMQNILEFYESYKKDMKVVVMQDNYRSTQAILDCSKALIDNNKDRLVKKIEGLSKDLTARKEPYSSSKVEPIIKAYHNIKYEELGIVQEIQKLKEQGIPLNEIAIIYLRHKQAEEIVNLFEKKGISYNIVRKVNILELPIIQNIINILEYIKAETKIPYSGEHILFEIMHYRFFKLSIRDIAKISAHCGRNRKLTIREALHDKVLLNDIGLENPTAIIEFENKINNWIGEVHNQTLQTLFETIINSGGILRNTMESIDKTWTLQVLTTFFDFLKGESMKNPNIRLSSFLDTLKKMEEENIKLQVNKTKFEENGVNFTTAHSAKGLEFEYVYLIGCTNNIWASKGRSNMFTLPDTITNSDEDNLTETSRRVFYVSLTRAKQHLQISYPKHSNEGKQLEKAQFIAEIEHNYPIQIIEEQIEEDIFTQLGFESLAESDLNKSSMPEKEFIDALLDKYSMSVTHLNKYLHCPVAFYYDTILRVPGAKSDALAFGSAVHYALKRLFDKMLESSDGNFPKSDDFLNDFIWDMQRNKASFTDEQFKRRTELAKEALPAYYQKYVQKWNKIVLPEYTIRDVEMEGIPLNGKLDKIEFDGLKANVVDYKTGKVSNGIKKLNRPSGKDPLGGDYWRQIVFYKILMDENRSENWNMLRGEIDFFEKDKKTKDFVKETVTVNSEDIAIVKEQIRSVYKGIMNHEFTNGCGEKECKWCNFVKNQYVSDKVELDEELETH